MLAHGASALMYLHQLPVGGKATDQHTVHMCHDQQCSSLAAKYVTLLGDGTTMCFCLNIMMLAACLWLR
jgi:hypothetical protein